MPIESLEARKSALCLFALRFALQRREFCANRVCIFLAKIKLICELLSDNQKVGAFLRRVLSFSCAVVQQTPRIHSIAQKCAQNSASKARFSFCFVAVFARITRSQQTKKKARREFSCTFLRVSLCSRVSRKNVQICNKQRTWLQTICASAELRFF